ncbi:MAG: DUF1566 domain-containing protein [Sterolibacterium sp.]
MKPLTYERLYLWGVSLGNGLSYQAIPVNAARTLPEVAAYLAVLNDAKIGERTDWRLPNIKELEQLIEYGRINPCINPDFFPSTPLGKFWSSTHDTSGGRWTVDTMSGMTSTEPSTARCFVWAVSGVEKPAHDWRLDATTATDLATGLTWKRSHEMVDPTHIDDGSSRVNWMRRDEAMALCVGGWRLPEVGELRGIIDESRYTPAIDTAIFTPTPFQAQFLTATRALDAYGNANQWWRVSGDVGVALPGDDGRGYVRLVRYAGAAPMPTPAPTAPPVPTPAPTLPPTPAPTPAPTQPPITGSVTFTKAEYADLLTQWDGITSVLMSKL